MIQNQELNDCGVCALANLWAVTWDDAAYAIFGDKASNKIRFNTKTRQLADVALNHGRLIRVKDWRDIPDKSIVKVITGECEGTGNWHWVAWRDGLIWDSLHYVPLTPERYTPRLVSYIGRP